MRFFVRKCSWYWYLKCIWILCYQNDGHLNQCWLFISEVKWHSFGTDFTWDSSAINHWNKLECYLSKIWFKSPRGQWVKSWANKLCERDPWSCSGGLKNIDTGHIPSTVSELINKIFWKLILLQCPYSSSNQLRILVISWQISYRVMCKIINQSDDYCACRSDMYNSFTRLWNNVFVK